MYKLSSDTRPAFGDMAGHETNAPRELTSPEQEAVSGGFVPALMLAGAYIGHAGLLGASGGTISMGVGVAAHVISGVGLGYAAYSVGTAYGGAGSRRYSGVGEKHR